MVTGVSALRERHSLSSSADDVLAHATSTSGHLYFRHRLRAS